MLHTEPLSESARAFTGLNHNGIEGTVLSTIINAKIEDLKTLKVEKKERTLPLRSLKQALSTKEGRHFILECKKSSPTLGDFCKDFNLDRLLDCYERHASAVSVLCEKHFFKGSPEYLNYVKKKTALPVICKDFIICREQILEAYNYGADAILLMLSVLTKNAFEELYQYAESLGLEILTEVDTAEDAEYAISRKLKIVGINNRDLRTLKIDLNNARSLSEKFPESTILISESGICTHRDLTFLKPLRNFLIGSSISGADDVEFKANSMLYGINKICGLTTPEAVKAAVENHAAIGGLIFCKQSVRCLSLDKAIEITEGFKGKIRFAGVFVDEDIDTMIETAHKVGLSYLQLHGNESCSCILKIKEKAPELKIIKAINIREQDDFYKACEYAELCDLMILDSPSPGSGKSFNWDMIPKGLDKSKILLSGGIGPDNVQQALTYGFAGLDLNSRLEKVKGIKDIETVNKTFNLINRL